MAFIFMSSATCAQPTALRPADITTRTTCRTPDRTTHERHEGDLGNVKANGEGVAEVNVLAEGAKLHFIIGRSMVVHADVDDFKTQKPPGNAGARIGVGVIGVAGPPAPAKK